MNSTDSDGWPPDVPAGSDEFILKCVERRKAFAADTEKPVQPKFRPDRGSFDENSRT